MIATNENDKVAKDPSRQDSSYGRFSGGKKSDTLPQEFGSIGGHRRARPHFFSHKLHGDTLGTILTPLAHIIYIRAQAWGRVPRSPPTTPL